MTTRQWTIIGILFVAIGLVFCLLLFSVFATVTPTRTQVIVVVSATPLPFPSDTPTPRPTSTPQPTPTLAVMKMTIDEIETCCKDMTTIQENQYLASLVGNRVNWQGTVDDAKPDGTIWVMVSSTRIEMNGAPLEVAAKLVKGQFINFYAIITKAQDAFLMPGVQLRFESLK